MRLWNICRTWKNTENYKPITVSDLQFKHFQTIRLCCRTEESMSDDHLWKMPWKTWQKSFVGWFLIWWIGYFDSVCACVDQSYIRNLALFAHWASNFRASAVYTSCREQYTHTHERKKREEDEFTYKTIALSKTHVWNIRHW